MAVGVVDRYRPGFELERCGDTVEHPQPQSGDLVGVTMQVDEPGCHHLARDVQVNRGGQEPVPDLGDLLTGNRYVTDVVQPGLGIDHPPSAQDDVRTVHVVRSGIRLGGRTEPNVRHRSHTATVGSRQPGILRGVAIRWMTAFLDFPAATFEQGSAFWQAVTASAVSAPRGAQAEFATLLPAQGDAFLRVQRLQAGPAGCHLDLHSGDVPAAAAQAERLGAAVIGQHEGYVVLRSPGGLNFCVVGHDGEAERPPPARPGQYSSLVDQLSVDIPPEHYDRECAFWSRLTGWRQSSGSRPEFTFLGRADGMPLRLLLQRLDEPQAGHAGCTAHLDLACDDVPAERARHEALGARVVRFMPSWTTLQDPAGLSYCITRRNPATGKI